eukprot:TRINITY_DN3869_c0_g1_i1.p1 TRINITY_DN3869_c0_g1~~TRINITY_DN3869_c0_g1_i1.p1  ORF type:complete len:166 (+),score=27.94 TRINITY_DN3869_c0_g1_i1:115-612(+)
MGRPLKIDWAEDRKGGGKKKGGRVPDWVNNPLSERPDNCYSVFLGNLDFNITEDDVKKHFKDCGEIKTVRWMQKDGEFRGGGFVEFATTEAVDKAVKLCGKEIIGRAARVDYAKPRLQEINHPQRERALSLTSNDIVYYLLILCIYNNKHNGEKRKSTELTWPLV